MTIETTQRDGVLHAQGLTKRYGGRAVVDGVDVIVGAGEVVGLLGPRGGRSGQERRQDGSG